MLPTVAQCKTEKQSLTIWLWHSLTYTLASSLTCPLRQSDSDSLWQVVSDMRSPTWSLQHALSDRFSLTVSLWQILSDLLSQGCSFWHSHYNTLWHTLSHIIPLINTLWHSLIQTLSYSNSHKYIDESDKIQSLTIQGNLPAFSTTNLQSTSLHEYVHHWYPCVWLMHTRAGP